MKYCTHCGKEIVDEAVICIHCGCMVNSTNYVQNKKQETDAPNFGLAVLGFFIPIVGLILYLINKDETPLKAKSAGKGALIGVIVKTVLFVIYVIVVSLFISNYRYF